MNKRGQLSIRRLHPLVEALFGALIIIPSILLNQAIDSIKQWNQPYLFFYKWGLILIFYLIDILLWILVIYLIIDSILRLLGYDPLYKIIKEYLS